MHLRSLLSVVFIIVSGVGVFCSLPPASARSQSLKSSSFSVALETLQKHLNYDFQNIGLLRRAMTHASYSEENNKAFSILGESIIETTVSLGLLIKDVDISSKDLNNRISEISNVETSCAVDGMRLGLQNVVRVSSSTNSSTSSVVCGAFRAIFGAIALDTGKSDDAGDVFWVVHVGAGGAFSIFSREVNMVGLEDLFMARVDDMSGPQVDFRGEVNMVRLEDFLSGVAIFMHDISKPQNLTP